LAIMLDTDRALLAVMSHEILTPLHAIDGYVEMLASGLRGPMTPPQRADLERIRLSGQHVQRIVANMLAFARLEQGRVDVTLDDVPLHQVLREAADLIVPQMTRKGIRYVHQHCPPEVRVRADADRLRQVLVNLLSNAYKYTEAGGTVALRSVLRARDVHVEVEDSGCGIPADQLQTIFDPFVQLGPARTASDGLGLGLTISRAIARQMDGDLTVRSVVGVGSAFLLSLPRAAAPWLARPLGSRS
jgi:signal transduction histidine kinase